MSRANNGKPRVKHDSYPTPYPLAKAIVDRLDLRMGMRILEPSAGKGNFIKALRGRLGTGKFEDGRAHADITAIDIVDHAAACMEMGASRFITGDCVEIAKKAAATDERCDLIIGNPPFAVAEEHIRALIPLLAPNGTLAFILRVNFYGSVSRWAVDPKRPDVEPFWRKFPEYEFWPIVPRPSFGLNKKGKKGTDGTEYAVFLWRREVGVLDFRLLCDARRGEPIIGDWGDPIADAEMKAQYAARLAAESGTSAAAAAPAVPAAPAAPAAAAEEMLQ